MREIKFKAWINKLNCWADEVIISQVGDVWGYLAIKDNMGYHNAELCQFIGFCDENGKEIYEGDIIAPMKMPFLCSVVGFHRGKFCVFESISDEDDLAGLDEYIDYYRSVIIVGNIHENPKLLEKV